MTVPPYRTGTGSQPDPPPATAGAAVDDLFRLHAVDLVRFALMLVGDQSTAEDVVQDAFLGLYRAWDRLRDPDAVLGYLRTAVVNAYRVSRQGAPVTIATWTGGAPRLLPIGSRLLAMYGMPRSVSVLSPGWTGYLINPATGAKTAVRVPGLPGRKYV
jgi:hypothetical protein